MTQIPPHDVFQEHVVAMRSGPGDASWYWLGRSGATFAGGWCSGDPTDAAPWSRCWAWTDLSLARWAASLILVFCAVDVVLFGVKHRGVGQLERSS